MFLPSSRVRVYVCVEPVDMRKSFTGLCGVVREVVGEDPLNGHVFCFLNRRRTYVKLLYWDRSAWCIFARRLVQGTFGAVSKKELTSTVRDHF